MFEELEQNFDKKEATTTAYKQDKYIKDEDKVKQGRTRIIKNKTITVSFSLTEKQFEELNMEIKSSNCCGGNRSKFLKKLLHSQGIISDELTPTEKMLSKKK